MKTKFIKWITGVAAIACAVVVALRLSSAEERFYGRAKTEATIQVYQAYQKRFPKGEHIDEIQVLLEEQRYQLAVANNDIDTYKNFLSSFPDSQHFLDIESRLEELEYQNLIQNPLDVRQMKAFLETYPTNAHCAEVVQKLDDIDFDHAVSLSTLASVSEYLSNHPSSTHTHQAEELLEKLYYEQAISSKKTFDCEQYLNKYPQGKHAKEIVAILDDTSYDSIKGSSDLSKYRSYLAQFPKGRHAVEARAVLQEAEEREYYSTNSLTNGSQPYSSYYGYNILSGYGESAIRVTAPASSDVLVIIKRGGANGSVAGHAYIRQGCSWTIELRDGYYQTFFYYGKGWYPRKLMENGVRGGFLSNEVFSKDPSPQYLSNNILTYVLQLQANGNFQTSSSNSNEMF